LFFIGYYVVIALFSYLAPIFRWLFKILWPVLLVLFLVSLFTFISSSVGSSYVPIPASVDYPEETKPTTETLPIKDSIIKRFRKWKDYEGKYYEGTYTIRLRDYNQAKEFKNNISLYGESKASYDQIISKLKDNDNPKLYGIYHMFDSIQKANKLNPKHFAEMVVTFVQDIPYAIVLSDGCDPSLYDDRFTRNFLINNKGNCDGYQRFGINTPVEFITQLKGDCDTRTLLLYTILSHYKYDVAVMSSEFYGHSILGINLPYNGLSYNYNNQKYILWETTAFGSKPGIISNEISNTNYWRISLKSKLYE
jgi:hypothetical protein